MAEVADDRRRGALAPLAEATRRLSDAVATTAVASEVLAAAEADVRRAVDALDAAHSDDPYSGLMRGVDFADPAHTLPLSPIVGAFSPVRPEAQLWLDGDRVRGRARLHRKHVGPPRTAHGGVGALLADQLIAVVPWLFGLSTVTRSLSVRYRRGLPLECDLTLEGWGEVFDDHVAAHGTISAEGEECLAIEAELVPRQRFGR